MAKSALANALKERSAKSAAQSADVNDSVDEAFEGQALRLGYTRSNDLCSLIFFAKK